MTGATGALIGLLGGGGLAVALRHAPPLRRPRLDDRLAPYLCETAPGSRLLVADPARTPFPTLERLARPALADAARRLDRLLGGSLSVRRRLERAGRQASVEAFRVEQLLWGAGGLAGGLALALLTLARRPDASPVGLLVLCLLAAAAGVLARDRWLSAQVRRREDRILAEFPTVAELLALAVGAGEGPSGALARVAGSCSGELAAEFSRALADARAGASLVTALDGIAARAAIPALSRFVDAVAVAIERGTPLADVLRAQAADVREASRRSLLEAGGRKEIAMLVPVVFLILPTTVVFALFPGFHTLSLTAP